MSCAHIISSINLIIRVNNVTHPVQHVYVSTHLVQGKTHRVISYSLRHKHLHRIKWKLMKFLLFKQNKVVDTFFYRETECRNLSHETQERWVTCNADMLLAKKEHSEAELKMRETLKRARKKLEKEKKIQEEKELKKRKQKKRKYYAKEENARQRWNSEQEKYLTNILLEKKKLDVQILMDMKVLLDQLKEDEKQKNLKHEEKMKQQNTLTERMSVLFPKLVKVSCKLHTLLLKFHIIVLV